MGSGFNDGLILGVLEDESEVLGSEEAEVVDGVGGFGEVLLIAEEGERNGGVDGSARRVGWRNDGGGTLREHLFLF